jgi:hypothetical protein
VEVVSTEVVVVVELAVVEVLVLKVVVKGVVLVVVGVVFVVVVSDDRITHSLVILEYTQISLGRQPLLPTSLHSLLETALACYCCCGFSDAAINF